MTAVLGAGVTPRTDRLAGSVSGVWIAVGMAGLLAVVGVLTRPVLPVDETRYLTVAWEMRQSQDWLVPHLNGAAYSHKPPMLFWLINLAWTVFGEHSVVARLVPAAFLPITVWLAGVFGARIGGEAARSNAAAMTLSFLVFAVMGTLVMFDAMLSAACVAALIGLVAAAQGRPLRGFALVALMIGAGLLIKGPAALVPILPAAILAPLWAEPRQAWGRYYLGLAVAVAVGFGAALAWALPAAQAGGPAFGQAIFWGQTAGRMVKAFDHARPIWFFVALAPALFLPWTFSRNLWTSILRKAPEKPAPRLERLPWIAAAGTFVVFSLVSGKQAHYLAPAMPCLAAGMASLLARQPKPSPEPGFAVVAVLAGVAMIVLHPLGSRLGQGAFVAGGVVMMVAGVGVWRLRRDPGLAAAATSIAVFAGLQTTALMGGLATEHSDWVIPHLQGRRPVAFAGDYAGEFGYAARLTEPVRVIAPQQANSWLAANPGGVVVYPYRGVSAIVAPPSEIHPYKRGILGVWAATPIAEPADAPASR